MSDQVPQVFIVDDDEQIGNYCGAVLKGAGLSCSQWRTASDFLAQYDAHQPGCVVLDIRMPDMDGLQVQQQLNLRGATIPLIFITGFAEVPIAVEAMRHGAFDFLQKPIGPAELIDRVRQALAFDASTRSVKIEQQQNKDRFESLTEREREILGLLLSGLSNKEMASQLQVSPRTVEVHRARLMEKVGAKNTAHLVRMAMQWQGKEGTLAPAAAGGDQD